MSSGRGPSAADFDGAQRRLRESADGKGGGGSLLTVRAVAERLDVTAETVLRWIRDGDLPAIRLSTRATRVVERELEAWLRSKAT